MYLICREEFFDRKCPYGNGDRDYEDNADRFTFFCKGVIETMRLADLGADIVHAHDWQASLLPLLLREAERRFAVTLAMKTVFTVHNISFQGLFPAAFFQRTNLPEELFGVDGLEYYGQVNMLKGGILFSDRITTVSPRYAKEIQTPEFGCGLEGVVQTRADDLSGLINGVDTAVWNPATDKMIPARYSAANLAGKRACRGALLAHCGFDPAFTGPGVRDDLPPHRAEGGRSRALERRLLLLRGVPARSPGNRGQADRGGRPRPGDLVARVGLHVREVRRAHEPPGRGRAPTSS